MKSELRSRVFTDKDSKEKTGRKAIDSFYETISCNKELFFGLLIIAFLVLLAILAPLIAPFDPFTLNHTISLTPPSAEHWLGTDEFGRDIFSRIIYGARTSLLISVGAVVVSFIIGVPLGLIAGYLGGIADSVIMRIMDAILSFPQLLFAVLVVAFLGTRSSNLIFSIGFVFIPYFARLVRGNVLSIKHQDFVKASIACGSTRFHVMFRVILPNCVAPILVQASQSMGISLLIEAGLSFLGLGVQPPNPSWGSMLRVSQVYLRMAPWYVICPGGCIFLAVIGFILTSDGLRDALNPRVMG